MQQQNISTPQSNKQRASPKIRSQRQSFFDVDTPTKKSPQIVTNTQKLSAPLFKRYRPSSLKHFIGQKVVEDTSSELRKAMLKSKQNPSIPLPSLIIQGPSGCGKSTFARLYTSEISSYKTLILETYDMAGISNVKQAAITLRGTGKRVLLVVDEIHLLKGKQQDSLLSMTENGLITLVGVTSDSVLHKV